MKEEGGRMKAEKATSLPIAVSEEVALSAFILHLLAASIFSLPSPVT